MLSSQNLTAVFISQHSERHSYTVTVAVTITDLPPIQVSTWMGDRLRAGKPSRYATSHLGQLSLPSLWGR